MKLLQKANSNNGYIGNSILIFLIRVFPSLANILIVVFFSRILDKAEYGLYQNFWVDMFLLSTIASLGIQSFVVTYTSSSIASLLKSMRISQYLLVVTWVLALGVIFSLLQRGSVGLGIITATAFLCVYSFSIIFESLLTVFRKFKVLLWLSFIYTVCFGLLHWIFIRGEITLKELFISILILTILKLVPSIVLSIRAVVKDKSNAEQHNIKEVRRLWLHIGFFEVSQRLLSLVDKFIIGLVLSSELFAIYFNGTIQIPFLPLLLGAVGSAMLMQMADNKDQGDEQLVKIVKHSGRLLSAIVFPLFFFFFLYRYELFNVVFTNKYQSAIPIFMVAILVLPLRAYNFTTILQNKHKGAIINIGALIDLFFIIVLMYPLYQWLGLPGVALSFVLSSYIQGVYYLYKTAKVLSVPVSTLIPFVDWVKKLIIFLLLGIGIHYLSSKVFTEQIVLILGLVSTMVVIISALYLELRQKSNTDGEPVSQKKAE